MVIIPIVNQVIRAGIRLYATGPKFWGSRGYKQGYRQSIDHIVWIGGAVSETLKSTGGLETNYGSSIPVKSPPSFQSKTRNRYKFHRRCRYTGKYADNGRCSNTRSNYSRSSRYRM